MRSQKGLRAEKCLMFIIILLVAQPIQQEVPLFPRST